MVEMSVANDATRVTDKGPPGSVGRGVVASNGTKAGGGAMIPNGSSVGANGKQVKRKHFFEKFGTLLKQRSDAFLLQVNKPVQPHGEESDSPPASTRGLGDAAKAGSSVTPASSSSTAAQSPPVTAWGAPKTNVANGVPSGRVQSVATESELDVLYEKILHEIKQGNIIDRQKKVTEKTLQSYTQEVFGFDDNRRAQLEQRVESMLAQDIYLRVEVLEAKLNSKPQVDVVPEQLPNAFVIVYLQEKPRETHRTATIANTLNPSWNQQFPVAVKQDTKETLLIEVYDSSGNPSKLQRSLRIARKYLLFFFKPVASQCKRIGRASIPLESITSTGLVSWYNLSKKRKQDPQGTIKVKFFFTSKVPKETAKREYEQMLRLFLEYELRSSSVARYWWAGKLTNEGESILQQYTKCANLNANEQTLVAWFVYTQVHPTYSLSIGLLEGVLDKLIACYDTVLTTDEERERFWEGTRRLLPSCLSIVVKMRRRMAGDKDIVKTVSSVLHLLAKADQLATKKGVNLFDEETVRNLKRVSLDCTKHSTMKKATVLAVQLGTKTWFESSLSTAIEGNQTNEDKLRSLIKFVSVLQADLLRAQTYYDGVFKDVMGIDYSREICNQHEARIVSHFRPIVQTICNGFKKLTLRMDQLERRAEMESLDMSSTVFELYLILKLFLRQADEVVQKAHNPGILEFHQWFRGGIVYYLDVFSIKTFSRVVTVLEEDDLRKVVPDRKHSSSTGEILEIVQQIKIFWDQLDWPDKEEMRKFLKRSIGDICSCCIFYADRLMLKVKTLDGTTTSTIKGELNGAELDTLTRSLMVVSNVTTLIECLTRLPKELGYSTPRTNAGSEGTASDNVSGTPGRKTSLQEILDEEMLPIDGLGRWREKCVRFIADHIVQTMCRLLVGSADVSISIATTAGGTVTTTSTGNGVGGFFSSRTSNVSATEQLQRLKHWIIQSAALVKAELTEADLHAVEKELWTTIEPTLKEIIKKLLEKKESLGAFQRLRDCFTLLTTHYFGTLGDTIESSSIAERLDTFSCTTAELIHRYYLERCRQQEALEEPENGLLTVRCWFQPDGLHIKVLRAEQLRLPKDYKHSCDSYVKINVLPPDRFGPPALPELKTKTKSKNFSPTYNESFTLKINPVQHSVKDTLLMLNVKVSELLGLNQKHIGECFLRLDAIPVVRDASETHEIPSVTIPLSLPFTIESSSVTALENRSHDKSATQFLKKLKQKMGIAPYTMSTLSL
ncbi:protein unc-13 homolog 4B-like [Anopheles ziemanni]|uniref:protein unc-13 homolog 4B-like n=1 Tax=Anopheles coustani TaxID=139045 RepID=UPI002658A04D|nr:protein unc-13 homolog 4B-like [Anopheles coustani]XP_058169705.1 protein unc-13 homolog 4B-like [Anopheles ziemanni]